MEEVDKLKGKKKVWAIALILCGASWLALPLIAWYVWKAQKREKKENGEEE